MVLAVLGSLVPAQFAMAAVPKVVLDPDNDFARGLHDGIEYHGLPIQHEVALAVQANLPSVCAANVVVTRGDFPPFVANAARAAQMQDADVSVTLSLNANEGVEWGTPFDGGSSAFATSVAANLAFGTELTNQMGAFTGRPTTPVNEEQTGGRVYPYPEFAALPGTYAQFFMMFLDHSFDWEVISRGRAEMVDAIVTAIGRTLEHKGFKCLGKFPALPSAARLRQLRNLGYQRFLRYNAEPVSMSTGNFSTAQEIFSLSGVGSQAIDLTLNYNAQSGEDSPIGYGWQFAYGSYLQQYSDGTVVVFLPDGRALPFASDGDGGFTSPPGAFATLEQTSDTTFSWSTRTGTSLTFEQDAGGRGMLTSTKDRQGNVETLTYSGTGARFPRLASIADEAGQTVDVATNADGRITRFTRPDGAAWRLEYSAAGDLVSVTSPLGSERRHVYDDEHRITAQVGQDGVTFLRNAYDDRSRVVEQKNAFGQTRTLAYDDAAETTTYKDTAGAVTVYRWNSLGQVTETRDALAGTRTTSYNAETLPAAETDPLGRTTTMTYDASGQPTSQTDPAGNVVAATYNASGDRTSMSDAGGAAGATRAVQFDVNADGLPVTVTNPDGSKRHQTYDRSGDLTSSTDENGAVTTYDYDARGNTRRVTDPLGRETTMTYDSANRRTSTTDPLGRTTSYAYDAAGKLTRTTYADGSTERRTYDANDQLASVTDRRGGVTRYERDAELNVTSTTLPNGGVVRNTFDGEGRQTSTTDALGHTTTYNLDELGRRVATTDARGHTTKTEYDANGRVVAEQDATGATTTYALDANGRPVKVTDPAGGDTRLAWDAVGRRVGVTDQRGHGSSRTYNFRDQVVSETDAAGGVTTHAYDAAGRRVATTDPAGAVTRYRYDSAGQLLTVTDALGDVTTFAYDAAGNRTRATDPNGHTVTTEYDVMNLPVKRTDANGNATTLVRDDGGLVTASRDPLGHRTRFDYDAMGAPTATTDALGRTVAMQYDLAERPTAEIAADGVVTERRYDAVGNLTAVFRNARAGQTPGADVNVANRYAYDARNLLTTATDPNGRDTTYAYDDRGLLTSETDPLGRVTRYRYDAAGNLAARTDPRSVITSFAYDARNLVLSRSYSDETPDETFTYDVVGRPLTATNSVGGVSTAFDALGRVVSRADAAGRTLGYGYDARGNRTRMTLPGGAVVDYEHDAGDRLTRINSSLGAVQMTYDEDDHLRQVTRPNGTRTVATFDAADQLTGLTTAAGATTLASFGYAYDENGSVARRAQRVGETSTTDYTYDALRRLTRSAGGPLPSTYTYDAAGNRLTWAATDDPQTPKPRDPFVQTNAFDAAGQLISSREVRENGGATFTDVTTNQYDRNGNRLRSDTVAQAPGQSSGTRYDYDAANRLIAQAPTGDRPARGNGNGQRESTRSYDALGRLVTETTGTASKTWTSDGLRPILAGSSSGASFYMRDSAGGLLAERTPSAGVGWFVNDALGSVMGVTDSKAALKRPTTYSDYGFNLETSGSAFGFGGEPADSLLPPGNGIGNDTPVLNHYYARSYDPITGAWLQRDPLGFAPAMPETAAEYQFAGANPSSKTDLLGYWTLSVGAPAPQPKLTVSAATASWTAGALQGGSTTQIVQPASYNPQVTVDGRYLQNTVNPFSISSYGQARNRIAYGQVASSGAGGSLLTGLSVTFGSLVPGSALQGGSWLPGARTGDEPAYGSAGSTGWPSSLRIGPATAFSLTLNAYGAQGQTYIRTYTSGPLVGQTRFLPLPSDSVEKQIRDGAYGSSGKAAKQLLNNVSKGGFIFDGVTSGRDQWIRDQDSDQLTGQKVLRTVEVGGSTAVGGLYFGSWGLACGPAAIFCVPAAAAAGGAVSGWAAQKLNSWIENL